MELPWLKSFADNWRTRVSQDRVPHALLLAGRPGVGKRAAAAWLVRDRLGLPGHGEGPQHPWLKPEHADLHWLRPPEDKHSIGIEQVRDLVAELSLTSYGGGGKAAVVEPANAMTDNAANSLLKTLEEPPGDALIVLVVDRIGRLPATIFSRCQRINVALPPREMALDWLSQQDVGVDWPAALDLAGGAPLAALGLREKVDEARDMVLSFAGLLAGRGSALDIAARWAKLEPNFVLELMAQQVQDCIRAAQGGRSHNSLTGFPESVIRHIDTRNLFCYLDIINGLRAQAPGSFNVALTLESLLIEWAGGLRTCRARFGPGELLPGTATG